jgi:hypothetical protein
MQTFSPNSGNKAKRKSIRVLNVVRVGTYESTPKGLGWAIRCI